MWGQPESVVPGKIPIVMLNMSSNRDIVSD